ncbi:hypothetical protein [Pedobacter sp. V48]|uniref:hypothetical protein n=1 Tax=Pedobacter sp. V48 TaxID=509635 RepID=UPI0003E5AF74|nr:hypothetical protein [Pedobacter sp. V48]ETZ20981.1 hypothetical protein N824_02390 [Pedobacter sp. V48]
MKRLILIVIALVCLQELSNAQNKKPIPAWKAGNLDIIIFKTGRGDAIFTIMPDGTTMLSDPGELDLTDPRTESDRNSRAYPNASRFADEWISTYIRQVSPSKKPSFVDYAFITHFHDDHYGLIYEGARKSRNGDYYLSGMTGVGDQISFGKILDRGYPNYNTPVDIRTQLKKRNEIKEYNTLLNYIRYAEEKKKKDGTKIEQFEVGSDKQIVLNNNPKAYPNFSVRNIQGNGWVWNKDTGKNFYVYPDTTKYIPSENGLSLGYLITYGNFKFYHGGDIPGVVTIGNPEYYDVESKMASSIGRVDVAIANHHGGRDVLNPLFIKTLQPRVWFEVVWSSDQPSHETLTRMLSRSIYTGERDLFATDILPANKVVIGDLIDNSYKSTSGHIWLQVKPDGSYTVSTLETVDNMLRLKNSYGPYYSEKK